MEFIVKWKQIPTDIDSVIASFPKPINLLGFVDWNNDDFDDLLVATDYDIYVLFRPVEGVLLEFWPSESILPFSIPVKIVAFLIADVADTAERQYALDLTVSYEDDKKELHTVVLINNGQNAYDDLSEKCINLFPVPYFTGQPSLPISNNITYIGCLVKSILFLTLPSYASVLFRFYPDRSKFEVLGASEVTLTSTGAPNDFQVIMPHFSVLNARFLFLLVHQGVDKKAFYSRIGYFRYSPISIGSSILEMPKRIKSMFVVDAFLNAPPALFVHVDSSLQVYTTEGGGVFSPYFSIDVGADV